MKNKLALALLIVCAISFQGIISIQKLSNSITRLSILNPIASVNAQSGSAPELPRTFLDTTYAPPSGKTIAVASGGDFQAALNNAQPGDVITLQAGATFTGNFTLPNKSGSGWVVIRSSIADANLPPAGTRITPAYSGVLPKIVSPNSDPAIRATLGAHHYRFIGLEIGVKAGVSIYEIVNFGAGQSSLSQAPNNLIVDRCYIHGNPSDNARRGVNISSASTAIIDSHISEIHEVGADSQAICTWTGPGPFKIVNNYLEGAGENVMFGGADTNIQNLVPSDIEFRLNQVTKPLRWKLGHSSYAGIHWSVKNLFELKNAQRALVDSNVFENNWADGQAGFAIVFTPRNQSGGNPWAVVGDVTFTNNIVRHSGSGFNISGPDNEGGVSLPSQRITIRNNLIEDIDGKVWGSPTVAADGRMFQIVSGAENITIDHNTGFATGNILMTETASILNKGLIFTNNIVPHNTYGVLGTGSPTGTASLTKNFTSYVFQKNVIIGGQASAYPSGNFFLSSFDQVGFVNMGAGDYRLSSSSPYKNAGTDGKDIGCQLGTPTTPTPNPPSTPPTISGVNATNITASSASIVWNTGALCDSQVEFGPTAAYGSSTTPDKTLLTNHLVTLSGLSASATVHYRVISRDAAGNMAMSSDFSFVTQANPTTPPADIKAPVISAASATVTGANTASIRWATDEPSDTQVEYGVTVIYGGVSPLLATKVTDHTVTLAGLMPGTQYHFRMKSKDAAGNLAVSGDLTFKTSSNVSSGGSETTIGGAGAPQPVVWTRQDKLAQNGATLTKNAGCSGCESTAVSQQVLTSGNGYFQFVAAEANKERWIGLIQEGKAIAARSLNYSFVLGGVGITSIRENGVYVLETTYKVGDVFKIAVDNKVVRYYKNDILIYQSLVPATTPLVAGASILDLGGTVSNGVISTASSGQVVKAPGRKPIKSPIIASLRNLKR